MVAAFLICSLTPPCEVLHAVAYAPLVLGADGTHNAPVKKPSATANDDGGTPGEDTRVRNARHTLFDSLAERVLSECTFRIEMDTPASTNESPAASAVLVLALMRSKRENPIAVDMALDTISRALLLLCKRADKAPADLILTPEEITAVLHTHLPHGIPVMMSQSMAMQTALDVEKSLSLQES